MDYQIFISYRREGGEMLAMHLSHRLREKGFHVFFDMETMRSGKFNEQIFSVIDECSDFLLILTENALDRCGSSSDWLRLEAEHALETKKNIIPVLGKNFEFPETLPESIEEIRYCHGIHASTEFFDAVVEKIVSLLKAKVITSENQESPRIYSGPDEVTRAVWTKLIPPIRQSTLSHALRGEPVPSLGNFFQVVRENYNCLLYFRSALMGTDEKKMNSAVKVIRSIMCDTYAYSYGRKQEAAFNRVNGRLTEEAEAEADKAKTIVDMFNTFIEWYNEFTAYPVEERTCREAQKTALKAENQLSLLIGLVMNLFYDCLNEFDLYPF